MSASKVPWTQLALVLLLAGAGAWLWKAREGETPALDPLRFAAPADFVAVRVVYITGSDSLVVEQEADGRFWVTSPMRDIASETRIKQAIAAAGNLKPLRAIPDTNRAVYGLRDPNHQFSTIDAAGRRWTIALGDSSPVNSQVYAQVISTPDAGQSSQVASDIFLLREFGARRDFFPGSDSVRESVPLPLDSPIVDSVHVTTPSYRLRTQRLAKDNWQSLSPIGIELDPLPLNRGIRNLRSPVLRRYPKDVDRSKAGLDPPRATWVIFHKGIVDTVQFGNPIGNGDEIYVVPAKRNFVATMSSDFFRDYVDGWPRLARRELFSIDPDSVETIAFLEDKSVAIGREDQNLGTYRRENDLWFRDGGDTVQAQDALTRDLANLSKYRWINYHAEPPPAPVGNSDLTIRLATATRAETLRVHHEPGDSLTWAWSSYRDRWGQTTSKTLSLWQYRATHPQM